MRTIKRSGRIKRSIKRPQNMKGTTRKGTTRKGTTKGTTNPRKSIRRIKPRKHKTRRQSGGGFTSFITADDNPVNLRPQTYADQLKSAILKQKGKSGIDVKVELVDGKPKSWLIGGDGWSDATFGELERGAKDGRYQGFIDALKTHIPLWELELHFTKPGRSPESSKGIKLSHDQFCRLFINGPLDYPVLIQRFRERRYTCPGQSQQPQTFGPRYVPPPGPPPSSALRVAPSSAAGTSAAVTPQQSPVGQLVQMGFKEADVINALNSAKGDVQFAATMLVSAAADSGVSAAPVARGGPSAALSASPIPSSSVATIDDFLRAQNGTLPRVLGGGVCPKFTDALNEIKSGQKVSHWIWYIIPSSPGYSETSKFFGIGPRANVTPKQYLDNPTLSARYVDILTAIGAKLQDSKPSNVKQFLVDLMDVNKKDVDYEKLRDSLAIFYPFLAKRQLVNAEISLLVQHFKVPPQHAPQPTLSRIVQYVSPSTAQQYAEPGPSAALRVAPSSAALIPSRSPQSPSPFIPPCDEYIKFEHQISYTPDQPDKILKKTYNISVNDDISLGIALKWAEASQNCNAFYAASFVDYAANIENQNYESLSFKSLEMMSAAINPLSIKTQEIKDDGWCFYRAVLTAAQRNPDDVRKFAQAITYCVTKIFTNTEDVMKQSLNTRVNGIQSNITVAQLVKLISIPNLTSKQNPCVYPELDQCIGQAAAYILNKNIIVYNEKGDVIGKYCGTDSTDPNNQIYLVNTNGNHFDIITAH